MVSRKTFMGSWFGACREIFYPLFGKMTKETGLH